MSITKNFIDIKEFLKAIRPKGLREEAANVPPVTRRFVERLQSIIIGLLLDKNFSKKNLKKVMLSLEEPKSSILIDTGKIIYAFTVEKNEWFYKKGMDNGENYKWSPEIFIDAGEAYELSELGINIDFQKGTVTYDKS